MIFKIIYYETTPKDHLEDARVHCVVLKVRAVPSPQPTTAGMKERPRELSHRNNRSCFRSLRTQQRARPTRLTPTVPDPKAVLSRRSPKRGLVKRSTHELRPGTDAPEPALSLRRVQCSLERR